MTPLKRFWDLLKLDKKDVYQIFFYAIFSGLVSLSLPLGIQAITNFIQSGRVSVSWIVLIILVVIGVAFVGILSLMQLRITENLQQKIFVRSSFDFAVRFPKIKFEELYNTYPPDLANRFFDTMTIQKGISKLLIDFSGAMLQMFFGIILLSLYHPFFIVFGVLLFFLLYIIFKYSYNTGLETSLKESKFKYKVASWLQEMARNNFSFRNENSFDYALQKNDNLVSDYLNYREKHFNVIKKQFSQLIVFKMIITASLLSIGGFLVINQQMNIGQFVAAEIIILLVINSVEKIILGLETFYDVLTSVEKIGQVTDKHLEEDSETDIACYNTDIFLETENIGFKFPDSKNNILTAITLKINQGEKIVIDGENGSGKTTLIRILSGLLGQTSGSFYINDVTFRKINLKEYRSQISSIIYNETPFEGTILENITFNDKTISDKDLKWAIDAVQLSSFIKTLPKGLDTKIFPEGRQLSSSNAQKILLARSIIHKPKILFYEDPTDTMDEEVANEIIDFINSDKNQWTVIVSSKNPYWETKCNRVITMHKGTIVLDTKK
ncbi:peptidase domain-containing ABC transporter [Flavobacterium gawalongense]|uniref:ATP-binding cassette domain-containing protein n=1 Tax=Flavobacterium gawalongense TaxID=2594432 RepID=A0A553BZK1_9FLAO|nr:ATP-binding cassette domain-containing protein [Flavobacterium gawalongense]TRX04512.1 ATP-binding cassette domain-containing protein [Flavobacterium gawalongense]TRX10399.1 ATP-binding cassette domain-containing protein [Flavobacterium gawalongense]TRX13596.1 ATP-binding cassette domain-containing protein [Flavobacterium gawalongense]TRX15620.1 ATP-binding cassette domain-containing protein [Flavobacterium gawalongense]TRX31458.1 ATP-binding cassette domain-containing protein [Flavobacteri